MAMPCLLNETTLLIGELNPKKFRATTMFRMHKNTENGEKAPIGL